eukprot:Lithocolla_globosa_v1_NODE_1254_length_2729_cov_194.569933.p1 type:complete len:325 gc:universal NODE_1254_length_2729_cov_194.569933:878-1852(+)
MLLNKIFEKMNPEFLTRLIMKIFLKSNRLKPSFDSAKISIKDHMLIVALALNILQPPLRSETANMEVIYRDDKIEENKNYLIKSGSKSKKPWEFFLQDYKTVKASGEQRLEIRPELKSFLVKSFKILPRKYVLVKPSDINQPLLYRNWLTMIQDSLGPSTGIDTMRSAYVSQYLKGNPSQKEVEGLARMMLTSSEQLLSTYNKHDDKKPVSLPNPDKVAEKSVDNSGQEQKGTGSDSLIEDLRKARVIKIAVQLDKRKEYQRDYYLKNKEKILNRSKTNAKENKEAIYRQRVVDNIKTSRQLGGSYNVRESTLKKYNITSDDLE